MFSLVLKRTNTHFYRNPEQSLFLAGLAKKPHNAAKFTDIYFLGKTLSLKIS